jgi:RHS repeat-associated protein
MNGWLLAARGQTTRMSRNISIRSLAPEGIRRLNTTTALICLLACNAATHLAAQPALFINPDRTNVVVTWAGAGVLQTTSDVDGPWTNLTGASSPAVIQPDVGPQFFRLSVTGQSTLLEPPRMAFAAPSPAPSSAAHELIHVVQQGPAFLPEVNDEVLVLFHSGEFQHTAVDLQIKGRGLDFIWARQYRSRLGPNTAQGHRWDFSYNIRAQRAGPHIQVFDGGGRADIFFQQADGSYTADQFFREGRFDSNGIFKLMFADAGVWEFLPLDGRAAQGKIARIADRNGNALTFGYDTRGRLATIVDTLARTISVAYNSNGLIDSVTDFAGRQVRYLYYGSGDVNGSPGDLKTMTSPVVTGTPTGNDFPLGKTTTYTYTTGFAEDRRNHLLLTLMDPMGQTWLENTYSLANETDFDFLRMRAQRRGYTNEGRFFFYSADPSNPSHTRAMVQDQLLYTIGELNGTACLKEYLYDAGNRLVSLRAYTGRVVAGQPVTETQNRPTNPLRTNDPPFFETRWEWNVDSLPTRIVFPNGNSVTNTYELALDPNTPRRYRGNLHTRTQVPGPLGGDQTQIIEKFEHNPAFGTEARFPRKSFIAAGSDTHGDFDCGLANAFITRHVDGRTNETLHAYDTRGNRTNTIHRIPNIVQDFEYNQFGQLTGYVAPDNGSGHRARFNGKYYISGVTHGYLQQVIADAGSTGLNLTTTYEYDAVGNVVRMVDPRGNDTLFHVNPLDQVTRIESPAAAVVGGSTIRYQRDFFFDANDNLARVEVENRDETVAFLPNTHFTTSYDYEILNRVVRITQEVTPTNNLVTEFAYDANRNRTLVRLPEAVNGHQPDNVVQSDYDERSLLFQITRAPDTKESSTDRFDYDGNANCTRVAKVDGFTLKQKILEYDGFDRLAAMTDAMGNAATWHYDGNGNTITDRTDGETNDVAGSLGNVRLSETGYSYDAMDRLIRSDVAFFDTENQLPSGDGQSTTLFTYSANSQLLSVTDDNNHTYRYAYDRALRLQTTTDPRTNTVACAYDANSNPLQLTRVEKSDLGNPNQTFAMRYTYDALDRLSRISDNVSNTVQYAYDSRNNLTLLTDALGFKTRTEYDGQIRQITIIHDMDANNPSVSDAADIIIRKVWDDSSRLVQQTDDNTNTTTYVYDTLNRLVREVLADGTGITNSYDVHDNVVMQQDANGNSVNFDYDLLNRITNKTIVPGSGVSTDTTFEVFAYDGLSRLVRAQDNDSLVEFHWDSMSNVERELMDKLGTAQRTYDGNGNVLAHTYPGGRTLQLAYDPLDNLVQVQEGGQNTFAHKMVGPSRRERTDYANRTRADYFYDGVGGVPNPPNDFGVKRLIRKTHSLVGLGTILDDRSCTWDRRSNKTTSNDLRPGGSMSLHQYTYDAANRLTRTRVTHPSTGLLRDTGYVLDGAGNRTSVTNNGVRGFYTLNPTLPTPADFQVNQYTTTPMDERVYDENGNLERLNPGARDERQLEFDYADRLVRYVDPGNGRTNRFAYDALGRCIAKSTTERFGLATTNRYFWTSGQAPASQWFTTYWWQHHLIEEQDGAGATLATYVYDADGPVQVQRGTNTFFYHCDDVGNVTALTDRLGAVVERYEYDEFGSPQFFSGAGNAIPQSAIGNPYLFSGQRYDAETGLYDFGGRYLDPSAGQFITRDRLGVWGSSANMGNSRLYVGNLSWDNTEAHSSKPKEIVVVGSKVHGQPQLKPGIVVKIDVNADKAHGPLACFKHAADPATSRFVGSWAHTQEYRPGKVALTDYTFETPSHNSRGTSGSSLGGWSKATGLDVVLDTAEYQPSSSTGWYVTKPLVRVSAFRQGPDILKSTEDGGTWSYHNPKAFQIISAGGNNAVHSPNNDHRVFRSRSGHLLEQTSENHGTPGAISHPDFIWFPTRNSPDWTGWSSFYRSF